MSSQLPLVGVGGGVIPAVQPPVAGQAVFLDGLSAAALFQDAARATPASAGDPIGSWYDPVAGVGATQTGTARPQRTATGLQFDGANDALILDPLPVQSWPSLTIVTVLATGASVPAYQSAISAYQAGAVRWALGPNADSGYRHGWAGASANVLLGSPAGAYATSTGYAIAWRKGAAAGWRIRRGTVDGSLTADTSYPSLVPTIWLGAESVSSTYWFVGELRAVIIYPRELSDAELTTLLSWCSTRYTITL